MTSLVLGLGVLAVVVPALVALTRLVHRSRTGCSPLGVFLFVWSVELALGIANPLGLQVPRTSTVLLLLGGVAAFVVGYAAAFRWPSAGLVDQRVSRAPHVLLSELRSRRGVAVWLAGATGVLGSALFALLVLQLVGAHGLDPAGALLALRVGLAQGVTPSGFYFFYFFTLFVPLAVLLGRTTGHRRWYVAAGLATIALLATSGRTNAITALVWAVVVLFLLRGASRFQARQLLAVGAVLVACLVGFLVLGSALGKTYDNSIFANRYGADPPAPKPLVLPLLYASATVPTLDAQLQRRDIAGGPYNLLRPVLQVTSLVAPSPVEVPEKIQAFDDTPFPHNVATYVSPLHRDGGVLGVLLGSWVLGAVSGLAFAAWLRRPTPSLAVLVGLVATIDLATVNDAAFTELSALFQASLLLLALLVERQQARAVEVQAPPRSTASAHEQRPGPADPG